MKVKFPRSGERSVCPVNAVVEVLGDQWSFLLLRDMLLLKRSRFSEFMDADEGVATNILAKRLKHLTQHGLVEKFKDPSDGRGALYFPTDRALDLLPVLLAMLIWSDAYQPDADKYPELMALYKSDPDRAVAQLKQRALDFRDQSLG